MATVSNPYSFNITKNSSFSSATSIQPSLPTSDTSLYSTSGTIVNTTITIKIPSGVRVLRVDYRSARIIGPTQTWGAYGDGDRTTYVGVTANKTYSLSVMTPGGKIYVYYSASINVKTPNITDY